MEKSHSASKGSGGSKTVFLMFDRKAYVQAMIKSQKKQEGRM